MNGLSSLTVSINNVIVGIVPNSLSFKTGKGEQVVKTLSIGGGAVTPILFENDENKVGKVKFELFSSADKIELYYEWKSNSNNNAITLFNDDVTFTFTKMALINDPDIAIQSEGKFEINFEGNAAI